MSEQKNNSSANGQPPQEDQQEQAQAPVPQAGAANAVVTQQESANDEYSSPEFRWWMDRIRALMAAGDPDLVGMDDASLMEYVADVIEMDHEQRAYEAEMRASTNVPNCNGKKDA